MSSQQILQTERLLLRPMTMSDADQIQKLAGDSEIAARTLLIPHPYEDGMAEPWISSQEQRFKDGLGITCAIVSKEDSILIGCIGLDVDPEHDCGDIGYWIGKPFWGKGYCTEAGKCLIDYGFKILNLNCIAGNHFSDNPQSGNVMRKLGMKYEGSRRERKKKNGEYKDLCMFSILGAEYLASQQPTNCT